MSQSLEFLVVGTFPFTGSDQQMVDTSHNSM
jgi:hypothetical protein